MDDFTQNIVNRLDYREVLHKLLEQNTTSYTFSDQIIYRIIALISLTSGLSLEYVLELKWKALIFINSKGLVQVKDEIDITRYYVYPINEKLHQHLMTGYSSCKQPNLESKIIDGLSKSKCLESIQLSLFIAIGCKKVCELDELAKYRNKRLFQIFFGRRVLDVCGSSRESLKKLKAYFKLRTNEELFSFLGHNAKEDVKYQLMKISFVEGDGEYYLCGDTPSYLDDNKHFDIKIGKTWEHYPFQHFQVFYDFLVQVQLYRHEILAQGINLLLLISLTNGIRLSALLKLRWSDIISIDSEQRQMKIKDSFKFEERELYFNNRLKQKLEIYFSNIIKFIGDENIKVDTGTFKYNRTPHLDFSCFITRLKNPLTQPSLHREMIKALKEMQFPHAKKFTTKSTVIMYGRRLIELKGNHKPTIRALKHQFNIRKTDDLFEYLYIDDYKGYKEKALETFSSDFEHILYDI